MLTHTSKRQNLVNQIIALAIQYDLDGVNVDFEALEGAVGDGYIQFIRELSLKCANNRTGSFGGQLCTDREQQFL